MIVAIDDECMMDDRDPKHDNPNEYRNSAANNTLVYAPGKKWWSYLPQVGVLLVMLLFVSPMAYFFFQRAYTMFRDESVYRSPLAAALVWPLVFATLELVFNRVVDGPARKGVAKYMVEYIDSKTSIYEFPLDLDAVRKRVVSDSVANIETLADSFWETSIAINLSVAALASNVVNIIVLLNLVGISESNRVILQGSFFALALQFFLLAVLAPILRDNSAQDSGPLKILVSQMANLVGILLLLLSFLLISGVI